MQHLIINSDYPFLLKKISYFKLYNLKIGLATLFIKMRDFSKKIKYNFITFIYYNLLSKNLRQKGRIKTCYI